MGCCSSKSFEDIIDHIMSQFYFRIIRHELIVSDIEEFLSKKNKTYYEFLSMTKNAGLHSDVSFQTIYWEKCYVEHVDQYGVDGLLFIPLLLCEGDQVTKLEYIKQYLSININHSKENSLSSLIVELESFQNIIFTYLSCLTSMVVETMDDLYGSGENSVYYEKSREKDKENEKEKMRFCFAKEQILEFTKKQLFEYSKKNFYVHAGKFLEDKIEFLTNDKQVRKEIIAWYEKRKGQEDIVNRMEESIRRGTGTGTGTAEEGDIMGSRGGTGIGVGKTNSGFSG